MVQINYVNKLRMSCNTSSSREEHACLVSNYLLSHLAYCVIEILRLTYCLAKLLLIQCYETNYVFVALTIPFVIKSLNFHSNG